LALSIIIGSLGSIISWQTAPARGLFHAAEFGYLPTYFTKKNSAGMPIHIMLVQAVLVSLFCLAFLLIPSVNGFYWFLTALSTSIYMMMYIFLFLSAIKLRKKRKLDPKVFAIPGKKIGLYLTCIVGLMGCLMTITVGFFPPSTINVGNPVHYSFYMAGAMLLTLVSVSIFFIFKKFSKKRRRKST
jgi:glutamate:GABA antiporter